MTLFTEAAERMARAILSTDFGLCNPFCDDRPCLCANDCGANALTALIAFLSERGLRVVPVEATEGMVTAAIASIGQDQDDPSVRAKYREIIRQGNSAAPDVWGE